ncbi:MAG TPA: sulfatase [Planctomycetota bacterium]
MRSRTTLASVLFLGLATVAGAQEPQTEAARAKPQILFYLIDTCRADQLGFYGQERDTTPFLDALAEKSVVFERCYSQGPWTKPSMASLLTSHYPSETGMHAMFARLDDDWLTMPEALRDAGWHTAGFSANPIMGAWSNYAQGFDEFVESITLNNADPIHNASGSAQILGDAVLRRLAHPLPRPTFLYMHAVDPHEEYAPAPEFLAMFADPEREPSYREWWSLLLQTRPDVPGNHLTEANFDMAGVDPGEFVDYGRDLYDADVRATDHQIERLWKRLQDDGWDDNTVVVVTADHGEEFFEHGGTSHAYSVYNELLHVPLLIYAPGRLPGGLRISGPVRSIDVYPTLMALLGVDIPEGLRGRNLLPVIEAAAAGDDPGPAPAVFSELSEDPFGRHADSGSGIAMAVIEGRWKFILQLRSPSGREMPRKQLFDLEADSGETNNLAAEHPELVARFVHRLENWKARNMGHDSGAQELDPATLDPAVLAQLAALGYIDGDLPRPASSGAGAMPLIARAVLAESTRWTILELDPDPQDWRRGDGSSALPQHQERRRTTVDGVELTALRTAFTASLQPAGQTAAELRPARGIRAELRGHRVEVFVEEPGGRALVFFDASVLGAFHLPPPFPAALRRALDDARQ